MHRIVFRFTIGVFCAFLCTTLLWMSFIYWRYNVTALGNGVTSMDQVIVSMVEFGLENMAVPQKIPLTTLAENFQHAFGQPAEIVDIYDPRILDAHREQLRQGHVAIRLDSRLLGGAAKTFFFPIKETERVLAIGPLAPRRMMEWWQTILFFVSVLGIVSLTGLALAGPSLAVMHGLEKMTQRILSGDLSARIVNNTFGARFIPPDVKRIVDCLNRLADHNQQLLEKQQHLLQAVAHELRTPTARMRFELEMLAMAQTDQQREDRLESLDADVNEIDTFIDELVAYNRLDYGDSLDLMPVDVSAVFQTERSALSHIIGEKTIAIHGSTGLWIRADKRLFARALRNLIANAVRHCQKNVSVSCEPSGGEVLIHVDDDGPGIPEESRERIFEPFARLEGSRNKKSGGLGLGLAIVQRIIGLHEAKVMAGQAPSPLCGARFTMVWPQAEAPRVSHAPALAAKSAEPSEAAPKGST